MSTAAPAPVVTGFEGSFDPRLADAVNGGQSTYRGAFVVTLIDRALVAAVLPASLRPAHTIPSGETLHPVIFMLGQQANLRVLIAGNDFPAPDPPYTELILLVPFVVHVPGGDKWHSFAVRMYLDDQGAVRAGNNVYAYAKRLAGFETTSGSTSVLYAGAELFEAAVMRAGPWIDASLATATLPGFWLLQQILEMPIVGHDQRGDVCSYFEWEYSQAEVAPASSTHRFLQPFRPEMGGWPTGPLINAPDGAFKLRGIRWRLSYEPTHVPPTPLCRFASAIA
jgi:Acetoacetate decarboxylase (ADC)